MNTVIFEQHHHHAIRAYRDLSLTQRLPFNALPDVAGFVLFLPDNNGVDGQRDLLTALAKNQIGFDLRLPIGADEWRTIETCEINNVEHDNVHLGTVFEICRLSGYARQQRLPELADAKPLSDMPDFDFPDELPGFETTPAPDMVNHPPHYTANTSGVEVIEITQHLDFCRGNAFKYLARRHHKGAFEADTQKALWYLQRIADNYRAPPKFAGDHSKVIRFVLETNDSTTACTIMLWLVTPHSESFSLGGVRALKPLITALEAEA